MNNLSNSSKIKIQVAADASNLGIGAYIAYVYSDGSPKVVPHASRILSPTEKNYTQIQKEIIGLV